MLAIPADKVRLRCRHCRWTAADMLLAECSNAFPLGSKLNLFLHWDFMSMVEVVHCGTVSRCAVSILLYYQRNSCGRDLHILGANNFGTHLAMTTNQCCHF